MFKIVENFPRQVRHIENTWIPMPDGIQLAARIWIPVGAEQDPVPAILEYIPYRKRDMMRRRDSIHHPYFAGNGYACLRVDLRGSGDSGGILTDEYLPQELDDGVEILRWIAAQPWCNGKVGIIGISWGGFNGLQIAAMQPPELKAVISLSSTDDRYSDDIHHMGGCLLGDNLSWASTMFALNSCPPDPRIVGGKWRKMWFERLEGSGLWLDIWLRHQRRDDYWKHGSICENYSAIQCPVMAVSGWADGYSNAVFRLMSNLEVPRKGLVGPWSHKYPHLGEPGPAIGFLQEALRWWDYWLKGIETGIMAESMLRVWMQDSVPPTTRYTVRPGRWVTESSWPSPDIVFCEYPLGARRIGQPDEKMARASETITSPLGLGLFAGKWCSYAAAPDLPYDQRHEDGGALVFDSDPLTEQLEILGPPIVKLSLSTNKPQAMIAVRLSDIAPNHNITRVTYGLLNLTHRQSNEHPKLIDPWEVYRISIPLNDIAQRFPAGHKLRIAISTSYWPLAWAPPEPVMLTIHTGDSSLVLPVRKQKKEDQNLQPFDIPEGAPPPKSTIIAPEDHNWRVVRDLASDESTLEVVNDHGIKHIEEIDLSVQEKAQEWYTCQDNDYNSLRGETYWLCGFWRGSWQIKTVTRTILTSDRDNFYIHAELDAYEGNRRVHTNNWNRKIARDFV